MLKGIIIAALAALAIKSNADRRAEVKRAYDDHKKNGAPLPQYEERSMEWWEQGTLLKADGKKVKGHGTPAWCIWVAVVIGLFYLGLVMWSTSRH